jgi:hypothetical protein
MPRGTGINAVDTIQQRGRFFGHKRAYVDLLRGWLNADTRESFTSNVETEDALRLSLKRIDEEGLPLKEWRRELFLGTRMVPTRGSVISLNTSRIDFSEGWKFRQHLLFDQPLGFLYPEAFGLIENLWAMSNPYPLDTRNVPVQTMHRVTNVAAPKLIEILADWPMHEEERVQLDQLLLGIRHYAQMQDHLDTHLVFMDNLNARYRSREKKTSTNQEARWWRIDNLHVGRSANYAGDQFMRTNDAITVQVHRIVPRAFPGENPERDPVLALALAWPLGFQRSMIWQQA